MSQSRGWRGRSPSYEPPRRNRCPGLNKYSLLLSRSPSYEAPRGRRSPSYEAPRHNQSPERSRRSPPRSRRSPEHTAPRSRRTRSPSPSAGDEQEQDPGVSPPRGAPVATLNRSCTLSSSSPCYDWSCSHYLCNVNPAPTPPPPRAMKRSRSRSPRGGLDYPWEDQETLRTLNCQHCNVFLHDRWGGGGSSISPTPRDSMLAHLKGRPHLAQQQRLRDKEVRGWWVRVHCSLGWLVGPTDWFEWSY